VTRGDRGLKKQRDESMCSENLERAVGEGKKGKKGENGGGEEGQFPAFGSCVVEKFIRWPKDKVQWGFIRREDALLREGHQDSGGKSRLEKIQTGRREGGKKGEGDLEGGKI